MDTPGRDSESSSAAHTCVRFSRRVDVVLFSCWRGCSGSCRWNVGPAWAKLPGVSLVILHRGEESMETREFVPRIKKKKIFFKNLFSFHFIWKGKVREKNSFHLLIHFLNVYNTWSQVYYMDGRDPLPLLPSRVHRAGSWVRSRAGTEGQLPRHGRWYSHRHCIESWHLPEAL